MGGDAAGSRKRGLIGQMREMRCPLGAKGDPTEVKDCPVQRRRVPLPIGQCMPSLGLIVCIDRLATHCTIDLQRDRVLVTPAQVGPTMARWEPHWVSRTGSLPTAKARAFLAELTALEELMASVGL